MFSLRVKLTRCLDIEEVIVELHGLAGVELEQFLPFCNLAVDILERFGDMIRIGAFNDEIS